MRLFVVLMIFLCSCADNDDSRKVGVIKMHGMLDIPAGLTPLQTHYFKVDLQSTFPFDKISDQYEFQGNLAYLSIVDGYNWSFLQEAEIVQNNEGNPGVQPLFATDYYSETNTSQLLLLPFEEKIPASLALKPSPSFFIKLTPFRPNSQIFTLSIDLEINIIE